MTFKKFKISVLLLCVTGTLVAQKFEKKFSEKFYTNKDVVVDIKASNAEIDVTTWDRNEVAVEAVIEVDGLEKKEAEKYLNNWKFEALGNKTKVQINANRGNYYSFGKDNFVMFNQHGNNVPGIYRVAPHVEDEVIVLPNVANIEIPEIDFDALVIPDLEEFEFDFDKYAEDGDNYFIEWKDGANSITIKSKKEWEAFKKSKDYKKFKKKQEKRKKELKERAKELKKRREEHRKDREKIREEKRKMLEERRRIIKEERAEMARARDELRKINREEIKAALAKAQEQLKNTRFSYSFSSDSNEFTINGKKVKVTKKIIIKVPKNATFDLNTRHCKIKLPKGKVNGKVSYGAFKADAINGGKLNVSFSPVMIKSLNACTLLLNNVTDAKVASVTNTKIDTNSSEVRIDKILNNVEVINKYGELTILDVSPNYKTLKVLLNSCNADINLSKIKDELIYSIENSTPFYTKNSVMKFSVNEKTKKINGNFRLSTDNNTIEIKGKYTQLAVHE
ncbi:MAP7 domain-containing protein [uncultured Tenacibaculum sp.]|uniref:MAP7 domain-containing protein n=1 Tax=uncultured Tenacibaculum sp. TaxID=174713 RepID=UPI0026034827|nr:MAP7 domain-containing protein [uncultured Tenacibaculum sp.]